MDCRLSIHSALISAWTTISRITPEFLPATRGNFPPPETSTSGKRESFTGFSSPPGKENDHECEVSPSPLPRPGLIHRARADCAAGPFVQHADSQKVAERTSCAAA